MGVGSVHRCLIRFTFTPVPSVQLKHVLRRCTGFFRGSWRKRSHTGSNLSGLGLLSSTLKATQVGRLAALTSLESRPRSRRLTLPHLTAWAWLAGMNETFCYATAQSSAQIFAGRPDLPRWKGCISTLARSVGWGDPPGEDGGPTTVEM